MPGGLLLSELPRLTFDSNGAIQERKIRRRLNGETVDLVCDGQQNGNVYVPEYFDVESDVGDRIERQALTQYRKSNGLRHVIAPQLDSYEGIDNCNDRR